MRQSQALQIMKLGHNVFLTGEPGAGKTYTLRSFIDWARMKKRNIGITASTGIAATHLGGMTIHSFAGIGISDSLEERDLIRIASRAPLVKRLENLDILIIDEVSMLDSIRLDLVDQVLRFIRKKDESFGGVQVILCGDLFQLPPISRNRDSDEVDFIHFAQSWGGLELKVAYLTEQHRQENDELLDLLRSVRSGVVQQEHHDMLQSRHNHDIVDENMTRLFARNQNVDGLNAARLQAVEGEAQQFSMITKGRDRVVQSLIKSCLAPEVLELKVGAQVLFVANNPRVGFVNGTRGEVVDFDEDGPIVALQTGRRINVERHTWSVEDNGKSIAEVSQYPLRLAWAITIHKSQGMSLDAAEVDLSGAFTPGMGYVALSRLRSLDGLFLRGMNQMALRVHPEIAEFDEYLRGQSRVSLKFLDNINTSVLDKLDKKPPKPVALEVDETLLYKLKTWRSKQAQEQSVPAYVVFNDETLNLIAAEKPKDVNELTRIKGVGPKKLESYATEIIKLLESMK